MGPVTVVLWCGHNSISKPERAALENKGGRRGEKGTGPCQSEKVKEGTKGEGNPRDPDRTAGMVYLYDHWDQDVHTAAISPHPVC